MAESKKYVLKVTAGPSYDTKTHTPVKVNTDDPIKIDTEHLDATVYVRIQNYRGLPKDSPSTSPYFSNAPHTGDLYSISFAFTPKKPLSGVDVLFGNDFDHPIRDRLPPGFSHALKLVKWFVDPGLDGDVYADEPYLYGPLLSSINVMNIGEKDKTSKTMGTKIKSEEPLEEGATGESGKEARDDAGVPANNKARQKFFLNEQNRKDFLFEEGREYGMDFFNPYLDFNDFALKLPGFTLPIIRYWDGQPLRYVLKNKATGEPLFVIVFTLLPAEWETAANVSAGNEQRKSGQDDTSDDDVD